MLAAFALGGFFVFGTFHWWALASGSALLALALIVHWLWSSTARPSSQETKDVGLGLSLPTYVSGPASIGWWGMLIALLADFTAFVCLVFGYFFYWTARDDFPRPDASGPGVLWPSLGAGLVLAAWAAMLLARRANARDQGLACLGALGASAVLACVGCAALIAGPQRTGLDPTRHVYDATVWMLVLWTVFHVAIGVVVQLYCAARRWAGVLDARHDIDLQNSTLYWHFALLTALVTALVTAGFPLAS